MKSLRVKTVELLCALMTIVASAPLYAQTTPKVDTSQALENWRRQQAVSVAAEAKGAFKTQPTKAAGGPGLDGGGGVGVLTAQGQLRFLDLAIGDRSPLVRFDKESYREIMTRKGSFVLNKGTYVANADFFSCAVSKLSRQDNILLQFLKPENIRLYVVLTDLPLNQGSLRPSKVVYPSPSGTGYAWEATQLPASNLSSTSVPSEYQRPIASYAVQPTIQGSNPRQVLLVSAQMYAALSNRDRCALQVHELLRYVSNVGKNYGGIALLVKRSFTTSEIENLSRRILADQPVYVGEIPATNFFKYLAVNGSDQFTEGAIEKMKPSLYSPEDDYLLSSAEAEALYYSQGLSELIQTNYEEIAMKHGYSGNLTRMAVEQEKKLQGQRFDLRDLIH